MSGECFLTDSEPKFLMVKDVLKSNPNTILMGRINELVTDHCSKIVKKREDLILARLNELGYDTSNPEEVAKRCTVIPDPENKYYSMYIDDQDSRILVCV